jgi:large subunit ribosomal protein L12
MESIYAALILHKAQKKITEESLEKVLIAAGAEVDTEELKKIVASLKTTNLDELIKNASAMQMNVATTTNVDVKKPSKGKEKSEKEEEKEEEPAGIGSLF